MKNIYKVILFVLLGFSVNNGFASKTEPVIQETLLPFDIMAWNDWKLQGFEGLPTFYEIEPYFVYDLNENPILSDALKDYLPKEDRSELDMQYMKLEKRGRAFDSYFIMASDKNYIVNINEDNHVLSDLVIPDYYLSKTYLSKTYISNYHIDTNLKMSIRKEKVTFSPIQVATIRLKKETEKIYQVTDNGDIVMVSNKTFPAHLADYDPSNPDNCFTVVA